MAAATGEDREVERGTAPASPDARRTAVPMPAADADVTSALVYGHVPDHVASLPTDALQTSPQVPGSHRLEDIAAESISELLVAAPPGAIERRYVLALAWRALMPGGRLVAAAPKDKGGARIESDLSALADQVVATSRRHHRIVEATKTAEEPTADSQMFLSQAILEGGPQCLPGSGLWSQPGIFSWDRVDPGTALLMAELPALSGRGADIGCGIGLLARAVLGSPDVSSLVAVDIDRRAVEASRRNLNDGRVAVVWADARRAVAGVDGLDFVVMNPPFHDAGIEDRALGQALVRRAAAMLRPGGALWLVANRHLPYEGVLAPLFATVRPVAERNGYKIHEARA